MDGMTAPPVFSAYDLVAFSPPDSPRTYRIAPLTYRERIAFRAALAREAGLRPSPQDVSTALRTALREIAPSNLDPYMNTTNSVALFNAFRAGTPMSLMASIGSTPGNRFVAIEPNAKAIGMDPGARDGQGQHGVSFQADGADSAFYLAQF